NWIGFWLLGLCNNFAYVVMLSAAHDILKKQESQNDTASTSASLHVDFQVRNSSNSSIYDCNPVSTSAVLLADILPTLFIKLFAPFMIHKMPYGVRVLVCAGVAALSFLLVSFSSAVWMSLLGVIFASISSGLGELSFLSLTVFFSRKVLGGWGSGTGAAGLFGSLLYTGLIQGGLSPQLTLQIMLVVPTIVSRSFVRYLCTCANVQIFFLCMHLNCYLCSYFFIYRAQTVGPFIIFRLLQDQTTGPLSFKERIHVIRGLLMRFMIPLGIVYFAEYFINQGLMELLFFHNFYLSHAAQYRWYQTLYQLGVLISRSSLCCLKIRKLWVLSVLQVVNAVFLCFAVRYQFLPSAWVVFAIILYEGLLGGAAYVNTFHFISKEAEDRHREFAMAAASVGDSVGIALAGLAGFFVHSYFCSL
uniref:Battenin n=1 Tax=Amphilophus citrinellus TaxID=61819 RepID=A0A3Q0S689_AMPCI